MRVVILAGLVALICGAGFSASVQKVQRPCPVVADELDICAVIANAANYDGKEVTVGGVFETDLHGLIFRGRACPNDVVNLRMSGNWRGDPNAVAMMRAIGKKRNFPEAGEVIRGTFRVARGGQCFGQDCWLYEIEESELLCATTNTWDFNFASYRDPENSEVESATSDAALSIPSDYFPRGTIEGWDNFFGSFLNHFGEPSLLASAKDSSVVSYRFESVAGQSGRMLAVRMSLNAEGTAKIFVTDSFGASYSSHEGARVVRKTQTTVTATTVERFLQEVEEADFWAMPADVPIPKDASGRPKFYVTDSDLYVFEGVRDGKYHVVMRSWQKSAPFAEMVDSLVMDLGRLRGSAIPSRGAGR